MADTADNRITAIPNALDRRTSAGAGTVVTTDQNLNGPLGLAIAPNGDILTVNGGDGNIVETTQTAPRWPYAPWTRAALRPAWAPCSGSRWPNAPTASTTSWTPPRTRSICWAVMKARCAGALGRPRHTESFHRGLAPVCNRRRPSRVRPDRAGGWLR